MSKLCRKPFASSFRLLASASSMVWPQTNFSPIRRRPRSTPLRISGSPPRPIRRVSAALRLDSELVAVSLPVISSPQVAALTNSEGLLPTWACQSAVEILSRISASRVGVSGMRSSASRSEEHTSELQSRQNLVCRLLLEKKKLQNESQHEIARI